MISVSTAFLEKVNNGEIPHLSMQLTLASGTVYTIEDGQFWGESISFSEATSEDGAFTVGSAVIGSFNFALNNFDGSFNNVDFSGAVVVPLIYYEIDGTNEYLSKGIYYITSHVTSGNIIRCTAMDALKLLDQSQTSIEYPITVQSLVETICDANSITLATTSIPNGSFSLSEPTDSSGESITLTDRQMLSYACQCVGCFAKMNELGYLEIAWYDFDNPVTITSTFDGKSLWTTPIEVTGIRADIGSGSSVLMAMFIDANGNLNYVRPSTVSDVFTINSDGELVVTADSGVTYTLVNEELVRTGEEITQSEEDADSVSVLYGTDDRIIKIEGNPYITAINILTVCENVSGQIFDKEFRPGTLPVLANPCLEAGDVLQVTDNITGDTYLIPITSTIYNKSLVQNIICAFEDKEDADLRPNASYNMKVSVENAIKQAQQADEVAQAAQSIAEESGYQAIPVSNRGNGFVDDDTATITAVIYDREMNEVDADGTEYNYRWWVTQDSTVGTYLNGGKTITVPVDDSLCDYTAGIYFETKSIDQGIYPFSLSDRSENVLTMRDGTILTVRAAESAVTS